MNWTKYFLNITESVKLRSKDSGNHIGNPIVGEDNEILSTGYISFPIGSSMYLTCGISYSDCDKGIISSGIHKIWCKKQDTTKNRDFWDKHAEVSIQMFQESGVEIFFYESN